MEVFIIIALALLLCLTGAVCLKKVKNLEERVRTLERPEPDNAADDELERSYRKGLAGILSYSLREASGEDEI